MMPIDDFVKAERLAYYKAWRAANPDKVKKHNENYWRRRAERKLHEKQSIGENGARDADCDDE